MNDNESLHINPTTNSQPADSTLGIKHPRKFALVIQISFAIAISVLLILTMASLQPGQGISGGLAFTMLIFVCSAIGMWGGLGNWHLRWIPLAPAAPAMGCLGAYSFPGSDGPEFHVFCLSVITIVFFTSLGLKAYQGRLQFVTDSEIHADALQFGIKHIFGWTTAVAVLVGVARIIYPSMIDAPPTSNNGWMLLRIAALGSTISICVMINIWAMLGQNISFLKIGALLFGIAVAAVINWSVLPGSDMFFFWITITSQLVFALAMLVLRLNKVRFVEKAPIA